MKKCKKRTNLKKQIIFISMIIFIPIIIIFIILSLKTDDVDVIESVEFINYTKVEKENIDVYAESKNYYGWVDFEIDFNIADDEMLYEWGYIFIGNPSEMVNHFDYIEEIYLFDDEIVDFMRHYENNHLFERGFYDEYNIFKVQNLGNENLYMSIYDAADNDELYEGMVYVDIVGSDANKIDEYSGILYTIALNITGNKIKVDIVQ